MVLRLRVDDQARARCCCAAATSSRGRAVRPTRRRVPNGPAGEMVYRPVCSRAPLPSATATAAACGGRHCRWCSSTSGTTCRPPIWPRGCQRRGGPRGAGQWGLRAGGARRPGLGHALPEAAKPPGQSGSATWSSCPAVGQVALRWQVWHLGSPRLGRLTETVVRWHGVRLARAAG